MAAAEDPSIPSVVPPRREYLAAALIGAAAGILLCGYELVRSPSNTLYKAAYGADALPYVMAAVPLAVIAVLYLYGRLLSVLGARRTLIATTLGCAAALAGASLACRAGWRPAAVMLYLLREAYVVLLIEQYWSFLNSTLGTATARRLNGPICAAGSVGAILGGLLVRHLAEPVGTASLVLIAAAITAPAALVSDQAHRRCGEPRPSPAGAAATDSMGLSLFGRNPLLVLLLGVILLTQGVSTFLDVEFQRMLEVTIPAADPQTSFSGAFFAWLNAAALTMQLVVTPLLLRFVPIRLVHILIPLVHVGTCLLLLGHPSLATAGAAYLCFKAVDYSTFRAAKEMLYIPLSFDERYRAKEVIDVFGYRAGKGGASLAAWGIAAMSLPYAVGALTAAGLWAVLGVLLGLRGAGRAAAPPDGGDFRGLVAEATRATRQGA